MIGIKGTGMASLAKAYCSCGAIVTGSDIDEEFYTDELLRSLMLVPCRGFSPENLPESCDLVVVSSAYKAAENTELLEAKRRKLTVIDYPEALAGLSAEFQTCAVAGTHGKTSICAMIDYLLSELSQPHLAVYGSVFKKASGIPELQRIDTHKGDNDKPLKLCIEACEYRGHFLAYSPDCIVLTAVSHDHPDVFSNPEDVLLMFTEFVLKLPRKGLLIFCRDDEGSCEVQRRVQEKRSDITFIPYGRKAPGHYQMHSLASTPGEVTFSFADDEHVYAIGVPGLHMALNMAGAVAAVKEYFRLFCSDEGNQADLQ
nr:Mur ligase family protein [Spirochaetales bacterium]